MINLKEAENINNLEASINSKIIENIYELSIEELNNFNYKKFILNKEKNIFINEIKIDKKSVEVECIRGKIKLKIPYKGDFEILKYRSTSLFEVDYELESKDGFLIYNLKINTSDMEIKNIFNSLASYIENLRNSILRYNLGMENYVIQEVEKAKKIKLQLKSRSESITKLLRS